jgi:hypothetical protein
MTFTQQMKTFRTQLNGTYADIAQAFNTFFNPKRCLIQSIDASRLESTARSGTNRLRVLFGEASGLQGIGLRYYAAELVSNSSLTAQDQFNAYYQSGFCSVPMFYLDVTDHEAGLTSASRLFCIFALTDGGDGKGAGLFGFDQSLFVANPTVIIAPMGVGPCDIYDAYGKLLLSDYEVRNVDPVNDWLVNDRSMMFYDILSGTGIAIPTLCGASVLATDTPPPTPVPGLPCITKEVISQYPKLTDSAVGP